MKKTTTPSIIQFGAGALQKHLLSMHQEVEGVRQNTDTEPIHRMRVASRRFRTCLDLFGKYLPQKRLPAWLKAIRRVTRTLGPARDLDVQLITLDATLADLPDKRLRPGVMRIALRLRQQRSQLQSAVLQTMDVLTASPALQDLQSWLGEQIPPIETPPATLELYRLSHQSIQTRLGLLFSYEPFISEPTNVTELHAMRIAAKHLRYTIETFAPLYPDELKPYIVSIKTLQEQLGNIHDADVWQQILSRFNSEEHARVVDYFGLSTPMNFLNPGIHYFLTTRLQIRAQQYQDFMTTWQELITNGTWQELIQTLKRPVVERHSIYPAALPPTPSM